VKQQRTAGLAEGQITQFVEDDQIHAQQSLGDPPGFAVVLFALQQIDQIDRGVEAHALAVPGDAGHGQRSGQVGFTGARPTDQHHVLRGVGKGQTGQFADQTSVCAGGAEVEAGQVAVHRQLGHVHLVAHRAHGAICVLLFQQVFEQPLGRGCVRLTLSSGVYHEQETQDLHHRI